MTAGNASEKGEKSKKVTVKSGLLLLQADPEKIREKAAAHYSERKRKRLECKDKKSSTPTEPGPFLTHHSE